ncbi:AraC-type DNA-binding protein [Jatrophihabitans endophyticus]|uniref:AraC-type DNA-binding protein n=1 Tax=Jatrophihabitans endophyticus TaxID=1206085 RepID=A0A1M5KKI7_9ACTN|nr:AraC family transcriptional regulator [Jatrophihabitans endophyticus]SHG53354.1 AraC-type DNA-binding protein [Jatrophihabitans endophyticus]
MAESPGRYDVPPPGAIAWLDVSAENPDTWSGRLRTGPLGLQIAPMRNARAAYFFKGARLRGTRCVWSASTVSSTELYRPARAAVPAPFDSNVQLLARIDAEGSVFDPAGPAPAALRVHDPADEITEQFAGNGHLFTLSVPHAVIGLEAPAIKAMADRTYGLSPFQQQLLRSAAGLLVAGGEEFESAASLVGVDRYLAGLAGLLLRTAVSRPGPDLAHVESIRLRTDAIIFEQAADPELTPAIIAAQLNISLRQLYRAFTGTESPASRIRRRRLERAAEILAARSGPGHVERVAVECGFASAEYFSRAFRREFGLSPRAYRSAHRDSAGARTPG